MLPALKNARYVHVRVSSEQDGKKTSMESAKLEAFSMRWSLYVNEQGPVEALTTLYDFRARRKSCSRRNRDKEVKLSPWSAATRRRLGSDKTARRRNSTANQSAERALPQKSEISVLLIQVYSDRK